MNKEAHPTNNPTPTALRVIVLPDGRCVNIPTPQRRDVPMQIAQIPVAYHTTRVVIFCNMTRVRYRVRTTNWDSA